MLIVEDNLYMSFFNRQILADKPLIYLWTQYREILRPHLDWVQWCDVSSFRERLPVAICNWLIFYSWLISIWAVMIPKIVMVIIWVPTSTLIGSAHFNLLSGVINSKPLFSQMANSNPMDNHDNLPSIWTDVTTKITLHTWTSISYWIHKSKP